jgi:hypothetical protein
VAGNYSGPSYDWTIADLEGCAINEVFNVSFVVYDHIWLKFVPTTSAGPCATYIFDSQVFTDNYGNYSVGILQSLPPTVSSTELV